MLLHHVDEIGDAVARSDDGQVFALRASIAYALAPNEAISDTCVSVVSGAASSGLPAVSHASMIVVDGVIAITGRSIIREPLMTMRVNVRCPYTPQLTREYMLFVDPAGTPEQPVVSSTAAPAMTPAVSQRAPAAPQTAPRTRRAHCQRNPLPGAGRRFTVGNRATN